MSRSPAYLHLPSSRHSGSSKELSSEDQFFPPARTGGPAWGLPRAVDDCRAPPGADRSEGEFERAVLEKTSTVGAATAERVHRV